MLRDLSSKKQRKSSCSLVAEYRYIYTHIRARLVHTSHRDHLGQKGVCPRIVTRRYKVPEEFGVERVRRIGEHAATDILHKNLESTDSPAVPLVISELAASVCMPARLMAGL